jgi:hypothetical protein
MCGKKVAQKRQGLLLSYKPRYAGFLPDFLLNLDNLKIKVMDFEVVDFDRILSGIRMTV